MAMQISNRRRDEQLGLILYETANWTVTGAQGEVLSEVASLRIAVDKAADLTSTGHYVVALVRKLPTEIIVFAGQIHILTDHVSAEDSDPAAAEAMKA